MPLPYRLHRERIGNDCSGDGVNPFSTQSVVVVRPAEGWSRGSHDRPVSSTEADALRTGHVPDTELGVRKLVEDTTDKPPAFATGTRW